MAPDQDVIEPIEDPEIISTGSTTKEIGKSGAFSKLSRELSDTDLTNPVVARMLLDERDRLLQEKATLESYRDSYYKADKRAEVAESLIAGQKTNQVLYTISQTLGGAIFGAAFSIDDSQTFWIFLVIGAILSIGTIVINLFRK
jgi:hypothetical protein